jgi:hypothetical protein
VPSLLAWYYLAFVCVLKNASIVANNPQLAKSAIEYRFSSANIYENGVNEFGLLTHIEDFYN